MAELFPDDAGVRRGLIQWHLREGDPDGAEAVLRAAAARSPDDPQPALTLAQFLLEIRSPEAARAELEARIAAAADPRPFQRALAGLDFAQGRPEAGIAALRQLLDGAEPSDATRDLQLALAQMLAETGAAEESASLVETVIAGDPNHVEALKLRAKGAIEADRPEKAIQDLRIALSQAPNDPEIMTIMALAHEREGSRELAGERLARAVELSEKGPQESLRYARFLMQDDRIGPAEGVVVDALRQAPEDRGLLSMLGQIHLARRDWARADQVAALLRAQGGPEAKATAAGLETASLRGQGKTSDAIAALEGLAGADGADVRAMADLMQSYAEAGDLAAARGYLDGVFAADPASLPAKLMQAGLDQLAGDPAAAEAGYRAVIAAAPDLPQGYQALYAFLARPGPRRRGRGRARRRARRGAGKRAPRLRQGRDPRGARRHRRRDRRLRDALCRRHRLAGARQQPREPARELPRRPGEPRARLRHRPAAARLGGPAVPGHLRLDPAPPRRRRPGARLPRPGRRGAARQRARAVPPRRDRARARPPRRGARELRPGARRRRGRQPAAPARDRPRPHRRDRRGHPRRLSRLRARTRIM